MVKLTGTSGAFEWETGLRYQRTLGSFGSEELIQPYGLWVRKHADGYEVLASDAYMSAEDEDAPPPLAQLDRRFKRYQVRVAADALSSSLVGVFGDTSEAGAIRVPESLRGDEAHNRC